MHFNELSRIKCFLLPLILCTFTLPCPSATSAVSGFDHFAWLDVGEQYGLYWSVRHTNKSIHFAVAVNTTGWIGLGISKGLSGKMPKADIVIGWVASDGKGYLEDRYATAEARPSNDTQQDYELMGYSEQNGTTILKFKRKLNTCDLKDNKIMEGTTKVIWAFNENDPIPGDENSIGYHGFNAQRRGSRSLNLLNYAKSVSLPNDTKYFDLVNKKVDVPSKDTTYWCQAFKVSDLVNVTKKGYVIEIAPVIQKRDEGLVHHIVIYDCKSNFNESHLDVTGHCYGDMPASFEDCAGESAIYAWGIGGGNFKFPDHVGLPFGTSDTMKYIVMETHFDNPARRSDFKDASGLRLYYTEKKRQYEATTLTQGMDVGRSQLIPPRQESWINKGYCRRECSAQINTPNALNGNSIKIFASFPHAHTAGIAISTTLVRNGTEIKEIIRDDNYDFDYQQTHPMTEVEVKAGDEIITTCKYNTKNRADATIGGLSTKNEMCINFLLYYPRVNFTKCSSRNVWSEFYFTPKYANGKSWTGVAWNKSMIEELKYIQAVEPIFQTCLGLNARSYELNNQFKKVNITQPLPIPTDPCQTTTPPTSDTLPTSDTPPTSDATYIQPANVVMMALLLYFASIIVQWC